MKLLITGATGLVGSALMKRALDEGHSIHFLTTKKSNIPSVQTAKGFYWNPATSELDTECFDGVDVIVHLAGASISKRWTSRYKKQIYDSRVGGTQLLVDAVSKLGKAHQIKQVVGASAVGIYPSSFSACYSEDFNVQPGSYLECVVVDWEKAEDGFSALGIALAKLRIGLVLTPKGGVLEPLKIPTALGLGAAFGNGKQFQSWIHVDDLVQMILIASQQQWQGIFNAVSPNAVSQTIFTKLLAKAMKRPYFMPALPKFLIQLIAGEMSTLIFNSHKVSAKKVLDKGFKFRYTDLLTAFKSVL